MDVQENLVFLILILLYLKHLKLFDKFAWSLNSVQELDNLRTQISLCACCPILKRSTKDIVILHSVSVLRETRLSPQAPSAAYFVWHPTGALSSPLFSLSIAR